MVNSNKNEAVLDPAQTRPRHTVCPELARSYCRLTLARRAVVDNPTRQACGKNLRKPARKLHFGLKTNDFARSFGSKWSFYEVLSTVRLLKHNK